MKFGSLFSQVETKFVENPDESPPALLSHFQVANIARLAPVITATVIHVSEASDRRVRSRSHDLAAAGQKNHDDGGVVAPAQP